MKKIGLLVFTALLCLPVFAQDKKHNLEIAYEHSDYKYKEPHMANPIKTSGKKNGVSLKYTQRSILTSGDVSDSDNSFASLEFRYMNGDVDYDGWMHWTSGAVTPFSASNLKDYYFEAALKIGAVYRLADPLDIWPYLGLGWRQLRNHAEEMGAGGYQRTSTYIYLPLGTNLRYKASEKVSFTLNGQFDVLLHGNQYSRMTDTALFGDDSSNRQDKGYGIRVSVRGDVNMGKVGMFVEPFWRYWHIQNSEEQWFYPGGDPTQPGVSLVEPFNTTTEWGIRAGITF